MHRIRIYGKGFATGFLCGTAGIFVLALLALMHPLLESMVSPFLLPGRIFARMVEGQTASGWTVSGLYLLTGTFYGLAGVAIQYGMRRRSGYAPHKKIMKDSSR